mgnify:CR=1 FL=1
MNPILQINQQIIPASRPLRIYIRKVDPNGSITLTLIPKDPSNNLPKIYIKPNQIEIGSNIYSMPGLLQPNQVWLLQTNTDGTFQLVRYDATNPNNLIQLNRWSFPVQLNPLESFFAPLTPELRRLLAIRSDQLSQISLQTQGIDYQIY